MAADGRAAIADDHCRNGATMIHKYDGSRQVDSGVRWPCSLGSASGRVVIEIGCGRQRAIRQLCSR